MLTKITIEVALNAELDDHPGYDKHEVTRSDNSRNDYSSKTIRRKMARLKSIHRVIERVILNHNWSRRISDVYSLDLLPRKSN